MSVEALKQTQEDRIHELKGIILSMEIEQKRQPHAEKLTFITYDEYANAVIDLFKLARTDCGGAYHAAQVLLSLYNGAEFHVDLARMAGGLDSHYLHAVLVAIKGRGQLMREPHEVIEDGSTHFALLWEQWESLHVRNRYKKR